MPLGLTLNYNFRQGLGVKEERVCIHKWVLHIYVYVHVYSLTWIGLHYSVIPWSFPLSWFRTLHIFVNVRFCIVVIFHTQNKSHNKCALHQHQHKHENPLAFYLHFVTPVLITDELWKKDTKSIKGTQEACYRDKVIRLGVWGKSRVQCMLHWKGGTICCSMNEREEIYTVLRFCCWNIKVTLWYLEVIPFYVLIDLDSESLTVYYLSLFYHCPISFCSQYLAIGVMLHHA